MWRIRCGGACCFSSAVLSYWRLARNREDREWVYTLTRSMGQLDGILQGMTDAETGERGYSLTGEIPTYALPAGLMRSSRNQCRGAPANGGQPASAKFAEGWNR